VKQADAATSAVSEARSPADQMAAKQADNSGSPPPAADPPAKEEAQAAQPAQPALGAEAAKETAQAAPPSDAQSSAPQTPQVAERDANQKVASVAPETRPAQPYPETRPTTIAGWALIEVVDGMAVVQGPNGVWRVRHGDTVPGVGKVDSIVRWGNRWIVATTKGLISTP